MTTRRTFTKVDFPPQADVSAVLPKYYVNRLSVIDGDRKRPNAYTVRKGWFTWGHAGQTIYNRRDVPGSPVIIRSVVSPDTSYLTDSSFITAYDTESPLIGNTTVARAQAVSRLIGKIKENDWNAAVSIAETSESWKMIISSARRLYEAKKALKRGNLADMYRALGVSGALPKDRKGRTKLPKAKHVKDNASSYWLEVNFGWKPLLNDIYDAARAIANAIYAPAKPQICFVKGRGTHSSPGHTTPIPENRSSGWGAGSVYYRWFLRYEVGVYYTYSSELIALARSFGFTNPLSIAWETIPLSFVFDYVVGIGEWLENLTAFHGLDFHSGWETVVCEVYNVTTRGTTGVYFREYGWNPEEGQFLTNSYTRTGTINYTAKVVSMVRTPLSGFPATNPPKVRNGFEWDKDASKAVTLLALFRQFTSTKP